MSKDLSLKKVLALQKELEEALENYYHYMEVGDFRLAEMWDKIIEEIRLDIRSL